MSARDAVTNKLALASRKGSRSESSAILDQLAEWTGWDRDHARARLRAAGTVLASAPRKAPCPDLWGGRSGGPRAGVVVPALPGRQAPRPDAPPRRANAPPGAGPRDLRGAGRPALRHELGDRRPQAHRRALVGRLPGPVTHQARRPARVPDPRADLCGVGRRDPGLHRGRPRGPRGRQRHRRVLLHPHGHRRRHGLDGQPLGREQGDHLGLGGPGARHRPLPLPGPPNRLGQGSELINHHLFTYCEAHRITFTRSRSGNNDGGAYVEQQHWTRVRELLGATSASTPPPSSTC